MDKKKSRVGKKKSSTFKKLHGSALSFYYGNPAKDLKLVLVAGSGEKGTTTARFINDILIAGGEKSALFDKTPTTYSLNKFLSKAWKAGANYVVILATPESINNGSFLSLPIYAVVTTSLSSPEDALPLLKKSPHFIVLNRDDIYYPSLADIPAKTAKRSYGKKSDSDTHIIFEKLYKKGTEVALQINNKNLTVASFIPDEFAISAMVAATTLADLLNFSEDAILDGLATFDPEDIPEQTPAHNN